MILLPAVLVGFIAGNLWARLKHRPYSLPDVQFMWIVSIALLPQILAFYLPSSSRLFSKEVAGLMLVASQTGLLFFLWMNRHIPMFWILGIGLLLNFLVIVANGGLMPISPETIVRLAPEVPIQTWQVGERLAQTKDIILPTEQTRFVWLSDRFVSPDWYPIPTAFSLGDMILAIGVAGLLWQAGGERQDLPTGSRSLFKKRVRKKAS
jgi:hypothetical protein